MHRGWDDTHRKSTGISAGWWVGAGSSPAPPPSPMRKAGRCFVELQEQPLPRTPSLLKEGEPRQGHRTYREGSQLHRASLSRTWASCFPQNVRPLGVSLFLLLYPRNGGSIRSRLTCVCFQKGCVTWTLFLLLHEGPRCRRVAQACLCECPWAPVYLNKGAGKVPKWSNSSNSLFPAWHWPALQPFIITNKILMHFIYALMNFITNTINALTRLRHNTS